MSMQLCPVDLPQPVLPPSDVDKLKVEIAKINRCLRDIKEGSAEEDTYENLEVSIETINEIILSLDNSNDFYKIGGFNLLSPLLSSENAEVVAATAELIADLCQNNKFCQSKVLELNILEELVKLLKNNTNPKVKAKVLYAVSSLCRNNESSIKSLESTDILPVLMKILEDSDERLRARTAFFLSFLSHYESFRESFYQSDLVKILSKLLKGSEDSSTEHLLSALRSQVTKHLQSRVQCYDEDCNLKEMLLAKIELYNSKGEYEESREHCNSILAVCYPEKK